MEQHLSLTTDPYLRGGAAFDQNNEEGDWGLEWHDLAGQTHCPGCQCLNFCTEFDVGHEKTTAHDLLEHEMTGSDSLTAITRKASGESLDCSHCHRTTKSTNLTRPKTFPLSDLERQSVNFEQALRKPQPSFMLERKSLQYNDPEDEDIDDRSSEYRVNRWLDDPRLVPHTPRKTLFLRKERSNLGRRDALDLTGLGLMEEDESTSARRLLPRLRRRPAYSNPSNHVTFQTSQPRSSSSRNPVTRISFRERVEGLPHILRDYLRRLFELTMLGSTHTIGIEHTESRSKPVSDLQSTERRDQWAIQHDCAITSLDKPLSSAACSPASPASLYSALSFIRHEDTNVSTPPTPPPKDGPTIEHTTISQAHNLSA